MGLRSWISEVRHFGISLAATALDSLVISSCLRFRCLLWRYEVRAKNARLLGWQIVDKGKTGRTGGVVEPVEPMVPSVIGSDLRKREKTT